MNEELNNIPPSSNNEIQPGPQVIKTDVGSKDGQNKCPKCGATEISTNIATGKLRCDFCRFEFEPEKFEGMQEDLSTLKGDVIGSGATDIVADTNDVITLKCSSCGAEVVIDTASANQARCHWCRNVLSINQQIPNGAIPDLVLPFAVKKEDAQRKIEEFVGKRKFFAHPDFVKEFTTNNIMGVYFPYMLVDINANVELSGEGEIETRSYYVGSDDNKRHYYDADAYRVERKFDITIDDLSIESNSDRLNSSSREKTNNIINSIMPFDTENAVKYNSNYLRGFTSERRDTNIEQLKSIIEVQAKDIARYKANETIQNYDRGVAWRNETMNIKGTQWNAAYLPVWVYSYQQVNNDKKVLHYVVVNARTKETMGSVPIHMPKLIIVSSIVEIFGIIAMLLIDWEYNYIFLALGIIYFIFMYLRYRNSNARHFYEKETKTEMSNLVSRDDFIETRKKLTSSSIEGANNRSVRGANIGKNLINSIMENNNQKEGNDK